MLREIRAAGKDLGYGVSQRLELRVEFLLHRGSIGAQPVIDVSFPASLMDLVALFSAMDDGCHFGVQVEPDLLIG